MTPHFSQVPGFVIDHWKDHGSFWGAAAIIYSKTVTDAAGLAQRLRNSGCTDMSGERGPEMLISWAGNPPVWVPVIDFPVIYREWVSS